MDNHPAEVFDELWYRYKPKIYTYFRRQFDENTAEDLCQQTFMNAWKHISAHGICVRNYKSWLFSVARNVKNDHLRYVQLHRMNFNYENLYERDILVETNIDESIDFQKAFNKLSEEEKQLLSMAQYLKSREIGSVLGISASATRNRIQKAKQHLNEILKDYGIYA